MYARGQIGWTRSPIGTDADNEAIPEDEQDQFALLGGASSGSRVWVPGDVCEVPLCDQAAVEQEAGGGPRRDTRAGLQAAHLEPGNQR